MLCLNWNCTNRRRRRRRQRTDGCNFPFWARTTARVWKKLLRETVWVQQVLSSALPSCCCCCWSLDGWLDDDDDIGKMEDECWFFLRFCKGAILGQLQRQGKGGGTLRAAGHDGEDGWILRKCFFCRWSRSGEEPNSLHLSAHKLFFFEWNLISSFSSELSGFASCFFLPDSHLTILNSNATNFFN